MLNRFNRLLILLGTVSLCLLPAIASSTHSDPKTVAILEELEANRRLVVAENMTVAASMPAFWEVYDAYRSEISALQNQEFNLLSEFRDHFDDLTDPRANDLMTNYFELEQKMLAVRTAYIARFNEVISPKKTLRFYQIESKLDSIIRSDVSSVTPLVPDEPES